MSLTQYQGMLYTKQNLRHHLFTMYDEPSTTEAQLCNRRNGDSTGLRKATGRAEIAVRQSRMLGERHARALLLLKKK